MVTTSVLATPHATDALSAQAAGRTAIALYQIGRPALPGLGHALRHGVESLPRPPSVRAWDFLSIALAVFGTDRFVVRSPSPDSWTRVLALEVALAEPDFWSPHADALAAALRFLTGDIWSLRFVSGGARPPQFQGRLTDRDCACLFSGGMDSLIGAADLLAAGRRPLLVSQASPKEGQPQRYLASRLGLADHRFEGRVTERGQPPYEPSQRARSILFFAYGVLAAEGLNGELIVPENGLISINPPLTPRRLGSLSTRTTHPHFVSSLQAVFDSVGLSVRLTNPYGLKTKGEMLAACSWPGIGHLAASSYSCGKGKRLNKQCGRCVPCLIRRAAFHRGGVSDGTTYFAANLARFGGNDDVQAARLAGEHIGTRNMDRWAAQAGPLPPDPRLRMQYVDVVRRGLEELRTYCDSIRWP